ncbi:hypothetical protein AUP68_06306 [Ilyonectria robusta]
MRSWPSWPTVLFRKHHYLAAAEDRQRKLAGGVIFERELLQMKAIKRTRSWELQLQTETERTRRCFLCVGRATTLAPSDPAIERLIKPFYSPGDLSKHFKRHHLSNLQGDEELYRRLCKLSLDTKCTYRAVLRRCMELYQEEGRLDEPLCGTLHVIKSFLGGVGMAERSLRSATYDRGNTAAVITQFWPVMAYCPIQETRLLRGPRSTAPVSKGDASRTADTTDEGHRANDELQEAIVSVFVVNEKERRRRCFLRVGRATTLAPSDPAVERLINHFTLRAT